MRRRYWWRRKPRTNTISGDYVGRTGFGRTLSDSHLCKRCNRELMSDEQGICFVCELDLGEPW